MTKCRLAPLNDRVVIRPNEADSQTPGGIVLPENSKQPQLRGVILAVGPGALNDDGTRQPMPVAVGDEVVYPKYSGADVDFEGEELKILHVTEVLATV